MSGLEHESWPLLVTHNQSILDFEELLLLLSHFKARLSENGGREKVPQYFPFAAAVHGGPALEQDGSTLIQLHVTIHIS